MSFFKHKKINNDKPFGEELRKVRLRQSFGLEVVEEKTKVNIKYLEALEKSDFDNLPAEIYAVGFLRRYADFLKIDSQKIIEKFHNEQKLYHNLHDKEMQSQDIIKPNFSRKWLKHSSFVITPKLLISGMIIFLVIGVLGYIFYQVKSFAAAPPLSIAGNFANMKVKVNSITVEGQTDASASLAINNQPIAVDAEGRFSQEIQLISGINDIEVVAKNKANKITRQTIKIMAEY